MMTAVAPTKFQQDLELIGKFLLSLSTTATPAGNALITAENLIGKIDPALVPEIMAAQISVLVVGEALEILGTGQAANQNYWLGAPRAI